MKKFFILVSLLNVIMITTFAAEKCLEPFQTEIGKVSWYDEETDLVNKWKYVTDWVGQPVANGKCMVVTVSTINGSSDSAIGCRESVTAKVTDNKGISHTHNHYIDYTYTKKIPNDNSK